MPTKDEVTFIEIGPRELSVCAKLHRDGLPEDYCSVLGESFLLKVFYRHFLSLPRRVGFIAMIDGETAGFIVAASPTEFFDPLIKDNFLKMLGYMLKAVFRNPGIVLYSLMAPFILKGKNAYAPVEGDAELLYIVVADGMRGKRVGARLVEETIEPLKALGFKRYVVKTLEKTEETNKFYLRNGFTILKKAMGRVWFFREL